MDDKYINIETELPNMEPILKNSLQSEILEIKRVDDSCDKYEIECAHCPMLQEAKYVIFSPYIKKEDRKYEHFVFLDDTGRTLCHRSGKDFHLYGMLKPCTNLEVAEKQPFEY